MRFFLGFIAIPLAIAPFILAAHPATRNSFLIVGPAICIGAPAAGFWLGETIGKSGEGRAALGCLATVILFLLQAVWAFALAPRFIS
jgi:hypothetical protein